MPESRLLRTVTRPHRHKARWYTDDGGMELLLPPHIMEDMNFPLIITVTVELRDALNDGTGCVDA